MPATFMRSTLPILREDPSGPSTRGPHRIQAFAACELAGLMRYYLGYISNFTESYKMIGTLFHLIAAYHYAEILAKSGMVIPWLSIDLETRAREIYLTPWQDATKDWEQAQRAGGAYVRHYRGENWIPIAVETERWATLGEIDPGGPWPELDSEIVTCRNDLEVEVEGPGTIGINDFKTQSIYGQDLPKWNADTTPFRLDWQAADNMVVTTAHYRREGKRPPSFFAIQRVTRKTDAKKRHKFDRNPVTIPPTIMEDTPRLLRMGVRKELDVIDRMKAGHRVMRDGVVKGACYHRFGACDFADFCAGKSKEARALILAEQYHQRRVPGGFVP